MVQIIVPDIGDFDSVEIIEVLVAVGDSVEVEQSLITLESDKASMDVPSSHAGKIVELLVKVGDKVSQGTPIANVEAAEGAATDAPAEPSVADESPTTETVAASTPPTADRVEPPAATLTAQSTQVCVPNIGDFAEVEVIEVLISVGDEIEVEQTVITLESDKASMDVPSSAGGVVEQVLIKVGDKVSEGSPIAMVKGGASPVAESVESVKSADSVAATKPAADTPPPAAPTPPASPPTTPIANNATQSQYSRKPYAGPAVRHLARELGVDLTAVRGTGKNNRITKTDVQQYVKETIKAKTKGEAVGAGLPVMADIDFSQFGAVEIKPLSRINKLSAANLHRNWLIAPHVTQMADADVTDMEEFRQSLAEEAKKQGYRMTPLAFFIKAAAIALKHYPRFNASLQADAENLVLKNYFNIGVAVDTANGLVVPVLRHVDSMGIADIAKELGDISQKARDGKLSREQMQGGCFTISSLGGIGGTYFTPIINLPEVAILGVGRSTMQPHWDGDAFVPRLKLPLALSYDHRVIDGAEGARFISFYASLLSDIRRLSV